MRFRHHQTRLGRFLEDRTPLFYNLWGSAILLLGAGMDVRLTGLWLPRAGAVVAGAAAYTYFFDPRTSDDWWGLRQKGILFEAETPMAIPQGKLSVAELTKARRNAEVQRVHDKLSAMAARRKMTKRQWARATNQAHHRALQVQGFWVLIGTLVWAFGDVPVELLKCGSVPC